MINRKETKKVYVGNVPIGGNSFISIQSMTNTNTKDVKSTVSQIKKLEIQEVTLLEWRLMNLKIELL